MRLLLNYDYYSNISNSSCILYEYFNWKILSYDIYFSSGQFDFTSLYLIEIKIELTRPR